MYFNRPTPKPGETYKYYNSAHNYEVVAVAIHTEMPFGSDDSLVVVYKPVGGCPGDIFVQPLKTFLGAAMTSDGQPVLRFTKIDSNEIPGQLTLEEIMEGTVYETR